MSSETQKIGRPTKYDPSYVQKVQRVCLLGGTDEQIADFFGVHVDTVYHWKTQHPEFSEAIRESKILADIEVAHSLYAKARAGDTTAQIFWLKNRQRHSWRDRQDVEGKFSVQAVTIDLGMFTDQELALYESLNARALQAAPKKEQA